MSVSAYGFGDPCLPTRVATAPSGSAWLHEIKFDGYRLMVRRTAVGCACSQRPRLCAIQAVSETSRAQVLRGTLDHNFWVAHESRLAAA
jgi:hypothetical protein